MRRQLLVQLLLLVVASSSCVGAPADDFDAEQAAADQQSASDPSNWVSTRSERAGVVLICALLRWPYNSSSDDNLQRDTRNIVVVSPSLAHIAGHSFEPMASETRGYIQCFPGANASAEYSHLDFRVTRVPFGETIIELVDGSSTNTEFRATLDRVRADRNVITARYDATGSQRTTFLQKSGSVDCSVLVGALGVSLRGCR